MFKIGGPVRVFLSVRFPTSLYRDGLHFQSGNRSFYNSFGRFSYHVCTGTANWWKNHAFPINWLINPTETLDYGQTTSHKLDYGQTGDLSNQCCCYYSAVSAWLTRFLRGAELLFLFRFADGNGGMIDQSICHNFHVPNSKTVAKQRRLDWSTAIAVVTLKSVLN